jgi:exodeoxyribonuclease VII large subunit
MAVQPQQALRPLSVLELNTRIHDLLSARFQSVLVKGEVSGVSLSRGHTWFTLKDGRAAVSAVIFSSTARRLPFLPEDGQELIVTAQVDFHVPSGRVSLVVLKLDYDGAGKLRERIEQLKRRLEAEGAFRLERKRSLPFLPRCVALVTSPSGAVIHDLQQTIWDRFPNTRLILYPAQVQGLASQRSLCVALRQCDRDGLADVCIVARGGGSFEELIAFNQEPVVRAIQAMHMPVVTALGHTSDRTLADLVADREARTPTAAAEVVVPRKADLLRQLEERRSRLLRAGANALVAPRMQLSSRQRDLEREARDLLARRRERLQDLVARVRQHDPREVLRRRERNLIELRSRFERALVRLLRDQASALESRAQRLRSLGPQETLSRGYSICLDRGGRVLRSASETGSGASVSVLLYSGRLECSVDEVQQ